MEPPPSPALATPSSKQRLLSAVLPLLLLLGLLGAAYSMIFYAGPYRWLAELQLRMFHAYYVSVSVLFTLLLFTVPPLVAMRVLLMSGALAHGSFASALANPAARGAFSARFARARRWLIVLGVGVTVAVLSTRDLVVAARGKQLVALDVSALERGAEPESTWLRIDQGNVVWDSSLTTEERQKQLRYIPVVSKSWKPGMKVGALLRVSESEAEHLAEQPLQGTVDVTGVPGMVRSAYEEGELDVSDAVLLDVGESPEEKAAAARFMMPLSAILIALGGVLTFMRLR